MISLRPLAEVDSEFLFSWANDPAVISGSFLRGKSITRNDHTQWFKEKLTDPDCFLYIILDEHGERAGQVRFDRVSQSPTEAFISIGVAPTFRKKGIAAEAIAQGTDRVFSEKKITLVHAYIQPSNAASHKAFVNAGYTDGGLQTYKEVPAIYMFRAKS